MDAPVVGLLLAAGEGSRMGRPKALVPGWLAASAAALRDGGCASVVVVLGAEAERARSLVPESAEVVIAEDWSEGMGASLRAGLAGLADLPGLRRAGAALVSLVDLPDVGASVVARVLTAYDGSRVLARAAYDGRPGHPVLIGADHWSGVMESATGDRGARDYLAAHEVALVECGDLATGRDVDTRPSR